MKPIRVKTGYLAKVSSTLGHNGKGNTSLRCIMSGGKEINLDRVMHFENQENKETRYVLGTKLRSV